MSICRFCRADDYRLAAKDKYVCYGTRNYACESCVLARFDAKRLAELPTHEIVGRAALAQKYLETTGVAGLRRFSLKQLEGFLWKPIKNTIGEEAFSRHLKAVRNQMPAVGEKVRLLVDFPGNHWRSLPPVKADTVGIVRRAHPDTPTVCVDLIEDPSGKLTKAEIEAKREAYPLYPFLAVDVHPFDLEVVALAPFGEGA